MQNVSARLVQNIMRELNFPPVKKGRTMVQEHEEGMQGAILALAVKPVITPREVKLIFV